MLVHCFIQIEVGHSNEVPFAAVNRIQRNVLFQMGIYIYMLRLRYNNMRFCSRFKCFGRCSGSQEGNKNRVRARSVSFPDSSWGVFIVCGALIGGTDGGDTGAAAVFFQTTIDISHTRGQLCRHGLCCAQRPLPPDLLSSHKYYLMR